MDFTAGFIGIAANFSLGDTYLKGAESAKGDIMAFL